MTEKKKKTQIKTHKAAQNIAKCCEYTDRKLLQLHTVKKREEKEKHNINLNEK